MQRLTIAYRLDGGVIRHIIINTPTWLGVPFAVAHITTTISKFHGVAPKRVASIKSI